MEKNIYNINLLMEKICAGIEEFDDKVNFARAHKNFFNAFAYLGRAEVKSEICFDSSFEKYLSHWDFILEWWGPRLISIDNSCCENYVNSGDLVEIAGQFCPNLENIQLLITEDCIGKVAENLSQLTMLRKIHIIDFLWLSAYDNENKIHLDNLFNSLQSLANLRCLKLGTGALTKNEATQLNELTQLEELDIERLNSENVDDLSTLLGNLRVLKIESCLCIIPYLANLTHLEMIDEYPHGICHLDSQYNDQLQVLGIGNYNLEEEALARIADLRALKQLILEHTPSNAIDVLSRMPLEKIYTTDLSHNDILQLVRESSSLRVLTCDSHDIEFLPQLLDILDAKGFQPDEPFQLNINTEIEQSPPSLPKSNLLRLNLTHTPR